MAHEKVGLQKNITKRKLRLQPVGLALVSVINSENFQGL